MSNLIKTSVQLPQSTLDWLSTWKGLTQSQAIRLVLERAQWLESTYKEVDDLANQHFEQLSLCLKTYGLDNYNADRTICRILPSIINEKERDLIKAVEQMTVSDRLRLLDFTRQMMLTNLDDQEESRTRTHIHEPAREEQVSCQRI